MIRLTDVSDAVCAAFDTTPQALFGPCRTDATAHARFAGYALSRAYTKATLARIGKHYGDRDYTTIRHGIHRATQLRDDEIFGAAFRAAEARLDALTTATPVFRTRRKTTPAPRGAHIHETGSEVTAYRRMLEATGVEDAMHSTTSANTTPAQIEARYPWMLAEGARQSLQSTREEDAR